MTENTDEKILARAQEIRAERGGSLTDAMIRAEAELQPEASVPGEFTVTIPVKPRVARWILSEFAPVGGYSVEERLAAYLVTVLNRARISALRTAEEAPEITEGRAVTLRRTDFQRKVPE